jgi:hypothetical protein
MSFDDTCSVCGVHLYAFCEDAPTEIGHIGWKVLDSGEVLCVVCMSDRLASHQEALECIISHWRTSIGPGDPIWSLMHKVHLNRMTLEQVVEECKKLSQGEKSVVISKE